MIKTIISKGILPFLITCVFYIWVASLHLHYRVDGDEPHYVITAISIWEDLDLNTKNNYENEELRQQFYGHFNEWHAGPENGYVVFRGILLSAILSLPFAMFGIAGVKIFLAILCSFLSVAIFQILSLSKLSDNAKTLLTLAISLSLPYTYVANMIYGDMIVGILLIVALWIYHQKLPSSQALMLFIFFILPLIHIRYGIVSASILGYLYIENGLKKNQIKVWIQYGLLLTIYWLAVYVYVSMMTRGTGVDGYPIFKNLSTNIMMVFRNHLDAYSGLFITTPIWTLGLIGIGAFYNQEKRLFTFWTFVYFILVSTTSIIHDQIDFKGLTTTRYSWSFSLMWVFPLVIGIRTTSNILWLHFRRFIVPILSFYIAAQLVLLAYLNTLDRGSVIWFTPVSFLSTLLEDYLPHFRNTENWHVQIKNVYYFCAISLILISSFVARIYNSKWFIQIILSVFILPILWTTFITIRNHFFAVQYIYYPSHFNTVKPLSMEQKWFLRPSQLSTTLEQELQIWGPYVQLSSGKYRVNAYFSCEQSQKETTLGFMQIVGNGKVISETHITKHNAHLISMEYTLFEKTTTVEFKVWVFKGVSFDFHKIQLEKIASIQCGMFDKHSIISVDTIGQYFAYNMGSHGLASGRYKFENMTNVPVFLTVYTKNKLYFAINDSCNHINLADLMTDVKLILYTSAPVNQIKFKFHRVSNYNLNAKDNNYFLCAPMMHSGCEGVKRQMDMLKVSVDKPQICHAFYGPYIHMPKGKYDILVKLSKNIGGGLFDIIHNGNVLYQSQIPTEVTSHACTVTLSDDDVPHVLEYRMLVDSLCEVDLKYIQVKEIPEK